jgi:hypothetical protein
MLKKLRKASVKAEVGKLEKEEWWIGEVIMETEHFK